jgi:serine/threonine-protein kinase
VRQGDEVAGRYRLDELQGHGPMSEVWRAHDHTLDRTVAVKILSPTADLARFRREAQALAALAHENIMRVYDYGEDEAGPFMALEWLPGGTLEERLAGGPLPAAETRRVATGMAAGLAQLHARGLVHRDLKPANVLFDEDDRPKLGDFGLARRIAGAGTLTEAGTVLGTAAYLSPEQAVGEPAGAASDVYSFGVILFRMLTGELPFTADSAIALINMHRNDPPAAVEDLQPDAPPDLAALTAAALRKDPAQRPADGAALLAALGGEASTSVLAADTDATRVLPAPVPAPAAPPPGRDRRKWVVVALALVVLAAAGAIMAWAVTRGPATAGPGTAPATTHHHPTTQPPPTTTHAPPKTQPTTRPTTTAATSTRSTTTTPRTTQATTTMPATTTATISTTTTTPTTTAVTTTGLGATTTAVTGTTSLTNSVQMEADTHRPRSRARTARPTAARER